MNVKLVLVSALVAGAVTAAGMAQTAAPQTPAAPAATTPKAPPPPQAIPAKIAIIEFEQVAEATNEGQKAAADLQRKYEPKGADFEARQKEIDSLTKQLQDGAATMSEEEKASRARTIDTKTKQLQRDADDTKTSADSDWQEEVAKIEQKLGPVVMKYVQANGFTMLLDNTGPPQQGGMAVLWAPGTDISAAVVEQYNATTPGISAPARSSSAPKPTAPRPAAPKPAAPKQ
jgi:outer membrane protein